MSEVVSLDSALAHLRAGDLDSAERTCQALLAQPKERKGAKAKRGGQPAPSAPAWHLQGLIHHRRGRHHQALEAYDRALKLTPDDPELLLNRGNTLSALQRPDAALAMFERVLALRPDHIGALNNKANALQDLARPADALPLYARCLQRMPANALLHINRGTALRALGRDQEARSGFEAALRLEPANSSALSLLTSTLQVLGDPEVELHSLQALAGEGETPQEQARRAYQQGSVFMATGKDGEAAARFAEALTLDPSHREARLDLALLDYGQGRLSMAEQGFQALLRANPDDIAALNNLANVQRDMGRLEEGLACLDRAITIPPYRTEPLSNRLMTLQYHPGKSAAELLEAARQWGEKAEQRARDLLSGNTPQRPCHPRAAGAPLRVGYVSGDFWQHVVGLFFRDVLRHHDPAAVVPFLYSNNSRVDGLTQQLRAQAQAKGGDLIDISHLNDRTLRERILHDRIDVLVDLSGHSAHSRVNAFALRPAPVQISWLGYFASTGLVAMDAVIMDPWHAPSGSEQQFSEKILRLPHNRFCYTPVPGMPEVAPPPFERTGHITFGSFNNTCKLNDQVLESWARILSRVPGSHLLLKNRGFADGSYCERIRSFFVGHGISGERIEMRGISTHKQMLKEYGDLDIALDPFPFSGGYTSCEALWMGVPVVTLPQERVVSRQTFSFLACLGLEQELAAVDLEDYVERAVALAHHSSRLVALRSSLRQRMGQSALCDAKRFTRDLEALYVKAWQRVAADQPECASVSNSLKLVEGPATALSPDFTTRIHQILPPENSLARPALMLVCATTLKLDDFMGDSFLGRSFSNIPAQLRPGLLLLTDNSGGNRIGLSTFYNHAISLLSAGSNLAFVHDDVFIHDWDIALLVEAGLSQYDIIGVVGSSGGSKEMPGWLIDLTSDNQTRKRKDLQESGKVNHLLPTLFKRSSYGPYPKSCEQIDGMFMATCSQTLLSSGLRFDPLFDFHCYDADFCRSALERHLSIGTWDLNLTHGSKGQFDSAEWEQAASRWRSKWLANYDDRQPALKESPNNS